MTSQQFDIKWYRDGAGDVTCAGVSVGIKCVASIAVAEIGALLVDAAVLAAARVLFPTLVHICAETSSIFALN